MLPFSRRACQPFLMGKAPQRPALPRDTPKIRRANSEALLPRRGKQRRSRTLAAYPCPAGQGCVISPTLSFRIGGRRASNARIHAACFPRPKNRHLLAPSSHQNRNAAHTPLARGTDRRQLRANGAVSRHCRPGGLCPHPPKGHIPWESLLGERQPFPPLGSRPPKRRRRQAPARGLAAVCPHVRPIRNETKRPSPLLVGLGRVNPEPTALAGDTVA